MTALVVVANPVLRAALCALLDQRGFAVRQASSTALADTSFAQHAFALVALEDQPGDEHAQDLLRLVGEQRPETYRLLLGPNDPHSILAAFRAGASDYLPTPLDGAGLDAALSNFGRHRSVWEQRTRDAYERGAADQRHDLAGEVQSESLALMGRLATNLAHEINNPLTPIIGLAELLQDDQPPDSPVFTAAQTIIESARRIATTVQSLMGFTHSLSQRELSDLRILINQALQTMNHRLTDQNIRLRIKLPPAAVSVMASLAELKQALFLLFEHARQTMPNGGELAITLSRDEVIGGQSLAVLEVHDTAPPIAAYHLPTLFEPFYSHTTLGLDSGAGLAIARRIVDLHGGRIAVEVGAQQGNTFRVTLPLA